MQLILYLSAFLGQIFVPTVISLNEFECMSLHHHLHKLKLGSLSDFLLVFFYWVWMIILPATIKNIAVFFIYLLPLLIYYIQASTNIQFHCHINVLTASSNVSTNGSPPKLNDVLNIMDNLFA